MLILGELDDVCIWSARTPLPKKKQTKTNNKQTKNKQMQSLVHDGLRPLEVVFNVQERL